MRFRIAEAAVVLNDPRPLCGKHETEIETAPEFPAFLLHCPDGGEKDGPHAFIGNLRRVIRIGRDGSHAAGVQTLISIQGALVIHGGNHGDDSCSVRKGKDRNLGALQKFLDDDPLSAVTEFPVFHNRPHGIPGFFSCPGDKNAFPKSQPVGFNNAGQRAGSYVGVSLFSAVKSLEACGGNSVRLHQMLGKDLAPFDDGCIPAWTEAGNAGFFKQVHGTEYQGIIRRHDGKIHLFFHREVRNSAQILCPDGNAGRILCDPGVTRQTIDGFYFGIFPQRLDHGVLPSAAADHQQVHRDTLPFWLSDETAACR